MKKINEEDKILQNGKRVHMIGIGGSGMCPIAEILNNKGYILSGSDNNPSDPLTKVSKFAKVYMGHDEKNISDDIDVVIYSAAINKENVELKKAKQLGIPTIERSVALGCLSRMFNNVIGVCGTHGKTTTTALITQIMLQNNCQPNAVIGGKLPLIDHYGLTGDSENFVVESCEFVDTFLHIDEDIAVLLNIDNDHLDYFKTMDNLVSSFHKFVSKAKKVYVNGDDELSLKACQDIKGEVVTFGFDKKNDYYAVNEKLGDFGYEFDCYCHDEFIEHIKLNIVGKHNIYNALAAFVVAYEQHIDVKGIVDSIYQFKGAARRFELLGDYGFVLADDYGHHPTEIEATLLAAKALNFKRVIVIFQPFTFSRTAMLKEQFAKVLQIADEIILTEIMGSREVNTYGISSNDLKDLIFKKCVIIDKFEDIKNYCLENYGKGDLVITMGCGDIYKAARLIQKEKESN